MDLEELSLVRENQRSSNKQEEIKMRHSVVVVNIFKRVCRNFAQRCYDVNAVDVGIDLFPFQNSIDAFTRAYMQVSSSQADFAVSKSR